MRLIADLHVHGPYSIATSKALCLESLVAAAIRKGIDIVGTGDILHPAWREEAKTALEPANEGLYRLRPQRMSAPDGFGSGVRDVCFMLTAEISTIYSHGQRVRKVHHLVCLPTFDAADTLAGALSRIGSVSSDGRPILGIGSRDLLEIVLSTHPLAFLVPAHIWTPWFSVLGSRGGYDAIEECYGDLSGELFAIETGLSSDPPMNWRLSALDRFSIISNSDAHSADKVGREATVFHCEPTFAGIRDAMRGARGSIEQTLEFFPEEGKYHLDGHRACGVRLEPEETRATGGRCPACGSPVTVGVMHRVMELADRSAGYRSPHRPGFVRLVPLAEVLSQVLGIGVTSRAVQRAHAHVVRTLGPELFVLLEAPLADLERVGGDRLAEAIGNARAGTVSTLPGYDGAYGVIRLVGPPGKPAQSTGTPRSTQMSLPLVESPADASLDSDHERVRQAQGRVLVVIAGPGSGKTHLLVQRMVQCLGRGGPAIPVFGITFTRAAARELADRVKTMVSTGSALWTGTLHRLAHEILSRAGHELRLCDDAQRAILLQWTLAAHGQRISSSEARRLVQWTSAARNGATPATALPSIPPDLVLSAYEESKQQAGVIDYDDLIHRATELLTRSGAPAAHVCVDEFQDLDCGQYAFVLCLAANAVSVMAIGDPYQAIYGFRGSNPELITRLARETPGAHVVGLAGSYRCADDILRVADALVDREPAMRSRTSEKGRIELLHARSVTQEARMIAGRVREILGGVSLTDRDLGGIPLVRGFADIAILVRTASLMGAYARALSEVGIPWRRSRAMALSEDSRVGRLLAWLRLGLNPESHADLLLVRRWVPGEPPPPAPTSADIRLARDLVSGPSTDAILHMLRRGMADDLPPEPREALLEIARECPDPSEFVARVMTERDAGMIDVRAEAVRIMTMHASKGLQFGAVFVTGFREGLLPLRGSDPAEEQRLCYVAITRARSYVALTWSGGSSAVSRFAARIPSEAYTRPQSRRQGGVQMELELW